MGHGLSIKYKFDNSKSMSDTITNSISNQLKKSECLSFITFENEVQEQSKDLQYPLQALWEKICDEMQSKLNNESDDKIFRILLPDLN